MCCCNQVKLKLNTSNHNYIFFHMSLFDTTSWGPLPDVRKCSRRFSGGPSLSVPTGNSFIVSSNNALIQIVDLEVFWYTMCPSDLFSSPDLAFFQIVDLEGLCMLPGLIEPHTHPILLAEGLGVLDITGQHPMWTDLQTVSCKHTSINRLWWWW